MKSNIHKIIDGIQRAIIANTIRFLKVREKHKASPFWDSLTKEQKQEILLAYEESEDENNLIDSKKVFKRKK